MCSLLLLLKESVFAIMVSVPLFLYSCKKDSAAPDCGSVVITYSSTESQPCIATGSITINNPTVGDYLYKVGNRSFQSSPVFTALLPGSHTITVRSVTGCEEITQATINSTASGPLFAEVKTVLAANCFPCHTGINPQAGHDWAINCHIIDQWDRIKARAVDGNPSPMPQSGLISQADRDKITNWINAGHRYTD